MDIQFINCKEWGINPKWFKSSADRCKNSVPYAEGVLNTVFVNNPYIRALNNKYRSNDKPTDVLSFSYFNIQDIKKSGLIGEIYISVPIAKKQAKEYDHSIKSELNRLFVHGFLHIFGYDHEDDEDHRRMAKLEDEILS